MDGCGLVHRLVSTATKSIVPAAAQRDGTPVKAPTASMLPLVVLVRCGFFVGEFAGLVFSLPSAPAAGSSELGSRRGELSRGLLSICRRI